MLLTADAGTVASAIERKSSSYREDMAANSRSAIRGRPMWGGSLERTDKSM